MAQQANLGTVSAFALMLAGSAVAEGKTVGTTALCDRTADIEMSVAGGLELLEDASCFGNPEFRPNLWCSASLSFSGAGETRDIPIGGRLRHATGPFVHMIGADTVFSDADGATAKEDVFAVDAADYSFSDKVCGFVLSRIKTDGLADITADPVSTAGKDCHLGFAPGCRVDNVPELTGHVLAGPVVNSQENGVGASTTEAGHLAMPRYLYRIGAHMFVANDTGILTSDRNTRTANDGASTSRRPRLSRDCSVT